ncbi:MAG TPA: hypothetical protein VG711_13020 [Phycisphaerales bacterium]|nr:hypothetical protein [Phycisphaerales bacterium]
MPQFVHRSYRVFFIIVAAVLPLGVSVYLFAGGDKSTPADSDSSPVSTISELQPAPPPPADNPFIKAATSDPRSPITGVAIVAHHIADVQLYLSAIDQIHDMGANAISVFTPMFVDHVDSNEIRYVPSKCATDEQLIEILNRAHEHGMATALIPTILIENPGPKDWRGVIKPTDWNAWWTSYHESIDRFLSIMKLGHVDLFAVGSELNSTESQLDRWQEVIDQVRAEYHGAITYSANWDRYFKIHIWPQMDVMGVSSYFELCRDDPNAPMDDLVKDWRGEQEKMVAFAREQNKPMIITEVGYPTLPTATAHPWNYITNSSSVSDPNAQARGWQAFLGAWQEVFRNNASPAFGFFAYAWDPYYKGEPNDLGYGFRGKPSYKILSDAFKSLGKTPVDQRATSTSNGPLKASG